MCDALMEIVKPKVDAKIKEATENALKEGCIRGTIDLISKKLAKGMSVEEIAEWLEEPVETVQKLMKSMQKAILNGRQRIFSVAFFDG